VSELRSKLHPHIAKHRSPLCDRGYKLLNGARVARELLRMSNAGSLCIVAQDFLRRFARGAEAISMKTPYRLHELPRSARGFVERLMNFCLGALRGLAYNGLARLRRSLQDLPVALPDRFAFAQLRSIGDRLRFAPCARRATSALAASLTAVSKLAPNMVFVVSLQPGDRPSCP